MPDLFLDDLYDDTADTTHNRLLAWRASPGLASLVSSLALLHRTGDYVTTQNLSSAELEAAKAAYVAVQDALTFAQAMPGTGPELVDMADSAVSVAESLLKTGASALLGSTLLPMLEENGSRLFDLGSKLGGKDQALCALVEQIVKRVKALAKGQVTMVPTGWRVHDSSSTGKQVGMDEQNHCLLLVIGRGANAEYRMAICNTGAGRHRHAARVAAPTGHDQLALSVYLRGIAAERICDGAFWFLLLRPLVFGVTSADQGPEKIYRLFPFLNLEPLTSKRQTLAVPPADWAPTSTAHDPSHAALCFGPAFRAALSLAGLPDGRAAAIAARCRSALVAASCAALQVMPFPPKGFSKVSRLAWLRSCEGAGLRRGCKAHLSRCRILGRESRAWPWS